MAMSRFNRRTFLQGAAASAAALALPGAGEALASSPRSPVTIEFWAPTTDPLGHKIIANITDSFNKTIGMREGIYAKLSVVPGTSNNIKYTTAMTSSGSPDVVMTYSYSSVPAWAANNFIQPMDAYAQAVGVKQSDYFPIAWDMIRMNGHIWGLMQEFDFDMLYWNKAIHHGPPPKSIPELDAVQARYIKFDKHGNLIQAGIVPWDMGWYMDWATVWGASFYDHARGKWTINRPENRKFLEWFLKYVHMYGSREKTEAVKSATQAGFSGDYFHAGRSAFGIEGEYDPPALPQEAPKLKYGIAKLPTAPGVPYGTNVTGGGNLFLLPTKAPHPKEAATFIKYMGSFGAVMKWNIEEGNFPPVKAAVFSPSFLKALPYMTPWIETLEFNHMVPPIASPQFALFDGTLMPNAIDEVTFKRKTPAQALAYVDQKISAAVQQFKQFHPNWPTE